MSQPIQDDTTYDKGLYLDFILDLLHGCKWNCAGCGVDKLGQRGWGQHQDGLQTVQLMKEFSAKGWVTDHLEIGPTDFFTAENTEAILRDPHVQALTRIFNSTLLQTTFLTENMEPMASLINETFDSNQVINFFVVLAADQIDNETYLNRVIENKNRFLDMIHVKANPIPHPLLNAIIHPEGKGFSRDFVGSNRRIRQKWGRSPYHNFSRGRAASQDRTQVLELVDWLNEKFDTHVNAETEKDVNFYYGGKGRDGFSKHYSYKAGRWHHVPILYSPFVNEYPEFQISLKSPWSVEQFEAYELQLIVDQFASVERKPECKECSHLYMCTQYGVLRLQDALHVNRCIVPRQALLR